MLSGIAISGVHGPASESYICLMSTLDIANLTITERLNLIGELWDSLEADDVDLTPSQDAELERRMARFETDRLTAFSFADIEADLDRRTR